MCSFEMWLKPTDIETECLEVSLFFRTSLGLCLDWRRQKEFLLWSVVHDKEGFSWVVGINLTSGLFVNISNWVDQLRQFWSVHGQLYCTSLAHSGNKATIYRITILHWHLLFSKCGVHHKINIVQCYIIIYIYSIWVSRRIKPLNTSLIVIAILFLQDTWPAVHADDTLIINLEKDMPLIDSETYGPYNRH